MPRSHRPVRSVRAREPDSRVDTVVVSVAAPDADSVDTSDGHVIYAVASGATSLLTLVSATGDVLLAGELDYETATVHPLVVTATDGVSTASATVTVSCVDVNDNAPDFNPKAYRCSLRCRF